MAKEIINAALAAAEKAYAPYSKFKVGAAVQLKDGTIITGNNQENAAYPSGMCAERVALNYAKAQHPSIDVVRIAIASPSTTGIVTPCGACRQVMAEIAARQERDFEVVMVGEEETVTMSISELLPLAFKL